jgi:hypothetical protein
MDKDNLLIFITPTIVQDGDFHPDPTGFLQKQKPSLKPVMDPDSWWNRTKDIRDKSYDWSDPGALPPKPEPVIDDNTNNVAAEQSLQEKMDALDAQQKGIQTPASLPAPMLSSSFVEQTNAPRNVPMNGWMGYTPSASSGGTNAPAAGTNVPAGR